MDEKIEAGQHPRSTTILLKADQKHSHETSTSTLQRKGSAPSSALHPPNPQIFTDWLTLQLWITESLNLSAAGHYKSVGRLGGGFLRGFEFRLDAAFVSRRLGAVVRGAAFRLVSIGTEGALAERCIARVVGNGGSSHGISCPAWDWACPAAEARLPDTVAGDRDRGNGGRTLRDPACPAFRRSARDGEQLPQQGMARWMAVRVSVLRHHQRHGAGAGSGDESSTEFQLDSSGTGRDRDDGQKGKLSRIRDESSGRDCISDSLPVDALRLQLPAFGTREFCPVCNSDRTLRAAGA